MNDNTRAAYDAEMKELERMTQEFMKRGAPGDDEDEGQGGYTGEPLSKYKGKEKKLCKKLKRKYGEAPSSLLNLNNDNNSGGAGFPDLFAGFGDFGNFGGGIDGATFSFSSSSSFGGGNNVGTFERTETVIQNGRRVTKKVRSDGEDTIAEVEETIGGHTRRRKGRRKRRTATNNNLDDKIGL